MTTHIVAYELAGRTFWARVDAESAEEIVAVAPEVDVVDEFPGSVEPGALTAADLIPEVPLTAGLPDVILDAAVGRLV